MNQTIPRFHHARLKLEWADKHISQLKSEWKAFCERDFCKLVVEENSHGGQTLKVVSVEPLYAQFPLLLGDAIHNLRCSLDYAVNEILGWQDTRLSFPMSESREELKDSFRTRPESVGSKTKGKGRNAAVELAVSGIAQLFLDDIKPYKGGGNPLWVLNKLSQRDKHRLLLPILSIHEITGINAVDRNQNRVTDASAAVSAGGYVNMIHFGGGGLTIESYGKAIASILIDEPGIVQRESLFPALLQMRQACHETIGKLDIFLSSINWSPSN